MRVRVRILKEGFVPGVGYGPILTPMYLDRERYEQLSNLGYEIELVEDEILQPIPNTEPVEEEAEVEEQAEEESEVEEEATEEPETEAQEDEEAEVEESQVVVNDPNISADSFYTEDFLKTKAVCQKILDARQIQYVQSDKLAKLIEKVLESNPEKK